MTEVIIEPSRETNRRASPATIRLPKSGRLRKSSSCLPVFLQAQMLAQFADRLVLLVADPFGGGEQYPGDLGDRPALEAHLEDALLPGAEQFCCHLLHGGPVGGASIRHGALVGHSILQEGSALVAPLGPFLHRIDGPQELAPLIAVSQQDPVPLVRSDSLQQAREDVLGAVGPAVGVKASVAPASGAVTADIVD